MDRRIAAQVICAVLALAVSGGPVSAQSVPPDAASPGSTLTPSASPSETGSGVLIQDDFSDGTGWWTGSDEASSNAYRDGRYHVRIKQAKQSLWDWKALPDAYDRVQVQAQVQVEQGSGGGGPICGPADGDDPWFWAGVNGDGEWLVGRIVDTHLQVIVRGERLTPEGETPSSDAPAKVVLSCDVDPAADGDQVVAWVDGVQVADMVDQKVGPYGKAGIVYSADKAGASMWFDDLLVSHPDAVVTSPAPDTGSDATTSPPVGPASPTPSGAP